MREEASLGLDLFGSFSIKGKRTEDSNDKHCMLREK